MKVLWLINAPIPALCERAGLPVQVKEGWIEGLYNSLMALVREKKQDFELAMAFPQFSRSETIEGELDGNSFYGFYKEEDKPYKYNKRLEERLKYIIEKAAPDVVHIAGTEYEHAAAMVFFFKEINKRVLNMMLGFAAGIMVAASFWSLLAPAIEMAEKSSLPAWLVAAIGFLSGAAFLWLADRILPHAHFFAKEGEVEGIPTNWRRSILLVFSITLHNIPEGLAVGVAFGAAANSMSETGLLAAVAVALGIGIQNFPEGAAVSIPLRREGVSRMKSFMYGQASGLVEPIAGVIGAAMVTSMEAILPYALAFAARHWIYLCDCLLDFF